MPDLSSVLTTITQNLVNPIYPNGTSNPSIVGVQVTIVEGWPVRTELDKQMLAGNAMVSVYPTPEERVVTKFERVYEPSILTPATIIVTVTGLNVITVTGTITLPQAVMAIVNGTGYAYGLQAGDTVDTIAANWAAVIPNATASGNVVTITGAYSLQALVSTPYSASQELSRQDQVMMITCWCPTPAIRGILGGAIDVYMKQNYRIVLADNFFAQVFYKGNPWTDMLEQSLIFRRDLKYIIQYPTTVTNEFTSITDPFANVTQGYTDLT